MSKNETQQVRKAAFSTLLSQIDSNQPLLLLPLRLETHFREGSFPKYPAPGEKVPSSSASMEWRRELLNEAFSPFDTYIFQKKLAIERTMSELLEQKLAYLLKEYYNYDISAETNALVKEAAVLLPFVSRWRGDFYFVANLLGALRQCQVEVAIDRYSHLDTTICWQPRVRYSVLIPGLTPEEYRERTETMEPLVAFLKEWFIPFDVRCEVNIKEHHPVQGTHGRVTLDYNTEVKNNKE